MLLFNPLRRAELKQYKKKVINHANKGVDKAFDIANTASKVRIPQKIKRIMLITLIVILFFLLSVYAPVWILGEEKEPYYALAHDSNALSFNKSLGRGEFADQDFDGDGLTNAEEIEHDTDMFNPDTDGDGYLDGYEVKEKMNPIKKNNLAEKAEEIDRKKGKTLADPYSDEGLILWPDSYEDKANGVVIKMWDGYLIQNFNGWVQFPNSLKKYVRNYKDGTLKSLKYRETEDAYYISEDSYIIVFDKDPEYKYRITVAGNSYIFNNKAVGNFLSFMLPSKGRTYLKCAKLPIFAEGLDDVTTSINVVKYSSEYKDRLTKNTNQLTDLAKVWGTISNGKCVYVSFYNEDKGESIGIVYGYTPEGDLLIGDPETKNYAGKLSLKFKGKKLYKNDNLEKYTWFDFEGLGFNSKNGDRINFFGTEIDGTVKYLQ